MSKQSNTNRRTLSIDKHNNKVRIRFSYQGQRYMILTGLQYNDESLKIADLVRKKILHDIENSLFDTSLELYKKMLQTQTFVPGDKKEETVYNLHQIFETYLQYREKRREIPKGEVPTNYRGVRQVLKAWGLVKLSEVEELLWSKEYSASSHNNRLAYMKGFFTWGVKNNIFPFNPLDETARKKSVRFGDNARTPLSDEELKSIVNALETDKFCSPSSRYKHSHYAPFIKFMIYTGVRNAEAIGLRVEKVCFTKGTIAIDEVMARTEKGTHAGARKNKETKTGNKRLLPLTDELRELLHPLCVGRNGKEFVFLSPHGKPIDDKMLQRRVFSVVLKGLNIPHRNLYALRHSFGERALAQGMSAYAVATLMGHSTVETTFRNYVHLVNSIKELPDINIKG